MKILLPLQKVQLYIVLGVYNTYISNDLDSKANSNHTHSNYVTSDQVSSIVNQNIQSGVIQVSGSVIRKITRGTKTSITSQSVTISCSITDTSKVIVLLDVAQSKTNYPTGIYLKSVSTSNIVVDFNHGINDEYFTVAISYQIIEFI